MKPAPIDTSTWTDPGCDGCGGPWVNTVPPNSTSKYYCLECGKNYADIKKKETTHMTTQEVRDTEIPPPEAIETNGHANGRRRRAATPSGVVEVAEAFLAAQQDIVYARNGHLHAIDAEIARLESVRNRLLGQVSAASANEAKTRKPKASSKTKLAGPSAKFASAKKTRTPRENSVPARIMDWLAGAAGPMTAAAIAEALDLEPVQVHGALNAKLKAGKVTSSGARKERIWSLSE